MSDPLLSLTIYYQCIAMPIRRIFFAILIFSQQVAADVFKEGGEAYKKGDYETAAKKFQEVAEKNDHRAMYALGSMYASGRGVEKDYDQAFKWLSNSARYGRSDAQYKVGILYEEGLGTKQDYRRSARMYNTAAKKGYVPAQFRLGLSYAIGKGIKKDRVKAYAWLMTAERNMNDGLPLARIEITEATTVGTEETTVFNVMGVDVISAEREKLKALMEPDQIEASRVLVEKYLQYR